MSSFPFPPIKAMSAISPSIAYTAIEPYSRAPVTGIPQIATIYKPPIPRCPKKTNFRRSYPYTRHPIIAIRAISPIARRP